MSNFYRGKVRDVYTFDDKVVMVTTDRISCFDHILPQPIPGKGACLNKIAAHFLKATHKVAPNWFESMPHPNVMIGKKCKPIMVEMVIRGYLVGHAWREYKKGARELCGVPLPPEMKQFQRFPMPIITPTTKAEHDEDISKEEILERKLATVEQYNRMEEYTHALFWWGQTWAVEHNLILVDTKFEFGLYNGEVYLIDELLTPDSSRYFIKSDFEKAMEEGRSPKQLSKEFVRQWLMKNGFDGTDKHIGPPEMPEEFIQEVSAKYNRLCEMVTGT
jgi:phosphoribosylaminoimidazole-succinocarboxamide synthase